VWSQLDKIFGTGEQDRDTTLVKIFFQNLFMLR
jgi:hypothetical protein